MASVITVDRHGRPPFKDAISIGGNR